MVGQVAEPERPRLAELLAALSMVTDLARGQPPEQAMRACLLATYLAGTMQVSGADLTCVYYTTLLRFVGCTATSHEYAAALGGNDIAVRRAGDMTDPTDPRGAVQFFRALGEGSSLSDRARLVAAAVPSAKRVASEGARADCEVGARMARRFGLDREVERSLHQMFERWDGKGSPKKLRGEQIALPARFASVAYAAVAFLQAEGPHAAIGAVRRWSGRMLDPTIGRAFVASAADSLEAAGQEDAWVAVLEAEPGPGEWVSDRRLDEVASGFADGVDLKSPFLHGHSGGVARLAEATGRLLGMDDGQATLVRRAGLLHDLGRAGISTGVWDKPRGLTVSEWEQVRLHPYHTERILSRSPALRDVARVAGSHHERLDGSGYHRAVAAQALDLPARTLAAADAYHAITEERPHRPAWSPDDAARLVRGLPLDREAVGAVLEAAGHRVPRQRGEWPAGLTDREVEVLRLLVRGRSEKQIARQLFISPSTAHTHVAHIYGKTGVTTRAGAAMFAMEHDLIRPE